MRGFVDLHCHYLPSVDDGVRTVEDGVALLRGLASIGYELVVATPHIRTAMFENTPAGLQTSFDAFRKLMHDVPGLPDLGLGAEHFCDDLFHTRMLALDIQPYPGGKGALVELPSEFIPRRLDERFFEMTVRGLKPVLAHPERYTPLFKSTDPIDAALEVGALPLLDVMSLSGKYGRAPQRAAERMLDEGVYYAACTDCHRPRDVEVAEESIDRLHRLVGEEEARLLLGEHPRRILEGRVDA